MARKIPLRLVLMTNALSSGLTGLLFLALAAPVGAATGLSDVLLRVVGVGLLPFAAFVGKVARDPNPARVRAVSTLDFAWVAASVALVLLGGLETLGIALVLALAFAVEIFGTLQLLGVASLRRKLAAT